LLWANEIIIFPCEGMSVATLNLKRWLAGIFGHEVEILSLALEKLEAANIGVKTINANTNKKTNLNLYNSFVIKFGALNLFFFSSFLI